MVLSRPRNAESVQVEPEYAAALEALAEPLMYARWIGSGDVPGAPV